MISERDKLVEWLSRVANDVGSLDQQTRSREQLIAEIRKNYEIISVLIKVASGNATIVGTPPVN